ncbi:hypothetical protein [Halogeometricum limi]|uniref:Uncharacterized protein n=1 Tax=Halogeometricum limi TaxID=555875 RepID=A0A1I6GX23_9EURY|nr:hypothetical protein [Halogeometricum limi]SFR46785.1 hypothetical protein SAMN04488124_1653 [Halogeometricum limi]
MTYRAVLANRDIHCEHYTMTDHGVELYDETETFVAFVPYEHLQSLLNDDVDSEGDPSIL